jgi:hypothetical protein
VFAQDTLQNNKSFAFIHIFNGSSFGYFGIKYKLLNRLTLQGTFYVHKYDENNTDPFSDSKLKYDEYKPGIEVQYHFRKTENISCYGLLNLEIGFADSKLDVQGINENAYQGKISNRKYYLTFGVGVELWLLHNLTIGGQQGLTFAQHTSTLTESQRGESTTFKKLVYADQSKIILSFYL